MYLNCKTVFSFRYGTYSTNELVDAAVEHGVNALAITNINNTCNCWEFVKICLEKQVKPVIGTEIRNGDEFLYLLIAADNKGVSQINAFLTSHLINKTTFPARPDITALSNCNIVFPFGICDPGDLKFNEYIGLLPSEAGRLYKIDVIKHQSRFLIRQPVTVRDKAHHNLHRLLRAIDKNVLLSQLPSTSVCNEEETFLSPAALLTAFSRYPFIVTNTYRLLENCNVTVDFKSDKTKKTFSASVEDDRVLLEKLANDGLKSRYGKKNRAAAERVARELKIIHDLGFTAYFLINWDIIRYAQSRGFYYVGRGSGANSIVAYCLRITDVDPIELNLYFERFLNPHRTSPPDFDIDFSYTDRDEVIDYIFKRYGKNHVALLASYPTFQHDAIILQLGKVFGLPVEEIKSLQLSQQPVDHIQRLIMRYGRMMLNFPSHLSLHPCGMLISEEPIGNYAALFMPPKGFATAQLDMFVAEDIGLNKFDILSQRGLGHIREALSLIRENKGIDIDIHDTNKFKKDAAVADQVRSANTIGCFYIESPAMRQLLKKLRCDDYLTLVAASSIIRPGVSQSGMMREYIYRYRHPEKTVYLHPLFEEHMKETFGVMVFQEDVIRIAHFFAGLDLGEADILRRAMSGKYRSLNQFYLIRDKFYEGCNKMGHPEALAREVWRQMESFAGYSFNKAHSASFAVESYMSLYLKTYFPKEFMVAVINNFGGFYSRELYFLELLKTGGELHAPCVNNSDEYTNICGDRVYVGFIHIKGLQSGLVETMLDDRKRNGVYASVQDFVGRINPPLEQLNTLVSIGAFRFTGKSKKHLLWEANFLQKRNQPVLHQSPALFSDAPVELVLPPLHDDPLDDLYDQMELLGFTLCNPFQLADDDPSKYTPAAAFEQHVGREVSVLAYFIARKGVVTKTRDQMFFGTFVDSSLDWVDTVHFPGAAKEYPLHSGGFYKITGKVTEDFGAYTLEVSRMFRVGYKPRSYQV